MGVVMIRNGKRTKRETNEKLIYDDVIVSYHVLLEIVLMRSSYRPTFTKPPERAWSNDK